MVHQISEARWGHAGSCSQFDGVRGFSDGDDLRPTEQISAPGLSARKFHDAGGSPGTDFLVPVFVRESQAKRKAWRLRSELAAALAGARGWQRAGPSTYTGSSSPPGIGARAGIVVGGSKQTCRSRDWGRRRFES